MLRHLAKSDTANMVSVGTAMLPLTRLALVKNLVQRLNEPLVAGRPVMPLVHVRYCAAVEPVRCTLLAPLPGIVWREPGITWGAVPNGPLNF